MPLSNEDLAAEKKWWTRDDVFRKSLELPLTAKGALAQELRDTWERLNSSNTPGSAQRRVEIKNIVIGDVQKGKI